MLIKTFYQVCPGFLLKPLGSPTLNSYTFNSTLSSKYIQVIMPLSFPWKAFLAGFGNQETVQGTRAGQLATPLFTLIRLFLGQGQNLVFFHQTEYIAKIHP